MPVVAPYGSWKSPITTDLIVSSAIGLGQVALNGPDVYWVEMRPAEGGRMVIVRRDSDGETSDVTPKPFSVSHQGTRIRRRSLLGGPRRRRVLLQFFRSEASTGRTPEQRLGPLRRKVHCAMPTAFSTGSGSGSSA